MLIRTLIDEDDLLDMLMDRVKEWTEDYEEQKLYEIHYSKQIENGGFPNENINYIVDNDFVNNKTVISKLELKDYNIKYEYDERICATHNGLCLIDLY